jgi:transposase
VLQLRNRVEETGDTPEAAAEDYDLGLATVYQSFAYYHTHPEKMAAVRKTRKKKTDAHCEEIKSNRLDGVAAW